MYDYKYVGTIFHLAQLQSRRYPTAQGRPIAKLPAVDLEFFAIW